MKNILKKQKGIAAIAVVLIVVLSAVAGGTTFLGVRAAVTGDPFLQPFEDMGLIELDNETEDDDNKNKKDKELMESFDKEETSDSEESKFDKDDSDVSTEGEKSSLLVSAIEDEGVECYTIVVDLKEVADGVIPVIEEVLVSYMTANDMEDNVDDVLIEETLSSILDLVAEMFTDCEIILDCYANGNDVKQLLITVPYEQLVENVYYGLSDIEELVQEIDPTADLGIEYSSYEEMLEEIESILENDLTTKELQTALSEELGSEYQEIADSAECIVEDGKIQISFDLTSIDLDSYISEYSAELEELGIDSENVVESLVTVWNEYIDEVGYGGLIEEAMSALMV